MLRNLHRYTGWLLICSFSFGLTMHYPARVFAEDGPVAPDGEKIAQEKKAEQSEEQPQQESDSRENNETPETAAAETKHDKTGETGEGEALKPADESNDKIKLSPEEAVKLRNSLKIKSRRKQKQTKEKDAEDSVMKRIFDASDAKQKERFQIDYSPSKPDPLSADEETPFYKHWIFWTIIGVGAVSGVVIGLKYGLSSKKTMSIDVTRREP